MPAFDFTANGDLARIRRIAGESPKEFAPVDPVEICLRVLDGIQPLNALDIAAIEIDSKCSENDRQRLRRAFERIVSDRRTPESDTR